MPDVSLTGAPFDCIVKLVLAIPTAHMPAGKKHPESRQPNAKYKYKNCSQIL